MNIFLWVVQAAVALFSLSGGAFKAFKFEAVASTPFYAAIPRSGWTAIGVFEVLCGILLIVPAATKWMPVLTPVAAAVLAVESFALAALYARYSTKLDAQNPLLWVVIIGVAAAFIAWGRFALRPIAD